MTSPPDVPDAPEDPAIAAERARREALKLGQQDLQLAGGFGISGSTDISGGQGGVPEKFDLSLLDISERDRANAAIEEEREAALADFDLDITRQAEEAATRGGEGGPGLTDAEIAAQRDAIVQGFNEQITAENENVSLEDEQERDFQTRQNSIIDLINRRRQGLGVSTTGGSI